MSAENDVQGLLTTIAGFFPRLVAAAVVLLVALLAARLLQNLIYRTLDGLGLDRALREHRGLGDALEGRLRRRTVPTPRHRRFLGDDPDRRRNLAEHPRARLTGEHHHPTREPLGPHAGSPRHHARRDNGRGMAL